MEGEAKESTGVTRGQNAVHVLPLDWAALARVLGPIVDRIDLARSEPQLLVVTSDAESAAAAADALVGIVGVREVRVLAVSNSPRAARLLKSAPPHIVVGAPAAWHHAEAETTLVVALHEHHVRDRAVGDWAAREWSALRSLATAMIDAPDWLQATHADWLAALDLGELIAQNVAARRIDAARARALVEAPMRRCELLR